MSETQKADSTYTCTYCGGELAAPDVLAERDQLREARVRSEKRTAVAAAERDRYRAALEHIRNAGGSCPCGAWFKDEAKRPHALGCPVSAALDPTEAPHG